MLPKDKALTRMCVLKVSQKPNWTWKDWLRWKLLWTFFPWYSRQMRYRGFFCIADDCMHWHWGEKKPTNSKPSRLGFCSHADSRTAYALWRQEQGGDPPPMTGPEEFSRRHNGGGRLATRF